jgi:hypothetical protein
MDNNDAVDKYTDSGYKNNVISFKLARCGSMETEPILDILPISQHHGGGRYGKRSQV